MTETTPQSRADRLRAILRQTAEHHGIPQTAVIRTLAAELSRSPVTVGHWRYVPDTSHNAIPEPVLTLLELRHALGHFTTSGPLAASLAALSPSNSIPEADKLPCGNFTNP